MWFWIYIQTKDQLSEITGTVTFDKKYLSGEQSFFYGLFSNAKILYIRLPFLQRHR